MTIENINFLSEGEFTRTDDKIKAFARRFNGDSEKKLLALSTKLKGLYARRKYPRELSQRKYREFHKRTAAEVLNSGYANSCSDIGIAFVTLSREIGIPTMYLDCFEENWIQNQIDPIEEHIFSKVLIDGKWRNYEPLRGFCDDLTIPHGRYVEAGVGLDFNEIYMKINGVFQKEPVRILTLDDIRNAAKMFREGIKK